MEHHWKLFAIGSLGALLVVPALFQAPHGIAQQSVADMWSPAIIMRAPGNRFFSPVHASLLANGKIMMSGKNSPTLVAPDLGGDLVDFLFTPTPNGQSFPAETPATPVSTPLELPPPGVSVPPWQYFDALFCSGHSFMADGTLFTAGGTRWYHNSSTSLTLDVGLSYSLKYSVFTNTWTKVANLMKGAGAAFPMSPMRWYPQVIRLADSRMLVTSGSELLVASTGQYYLNKSVEAYDPPTDSWQVISQHSESPDVIWNRDYTHVFQLPNKVMNSDVLMFGEFGLPTFLSLAPSSTQRWATSTHPRPDSQAGQRPNYGASTAMLPIRVNNGEWGYANGSVLVAGGDFNTNHQTSVDIYNVGTDSWLPRIDMTTHRHHPATVVLPDGRIVVIGGHNMVNDTTVGQVQYVDPANNFQLSQGTSNMTEIRGYHTAAVLLPDGRVFVGGGKDTATASGGELGTFRYYYPDYMFKPRPVIWGASSTTMKYGQNFWVMWNSSTTVTDVVLMGMGSMTHSFDSNQRYVQLQFLGNTTSTWPNTQYAVVKGPPTPETAPPGIYMIFVIDQNRVPSAGGVIRLTN